ncbi:hypothetical protein [Agrococcus sp. Marseille-P2731]|uniref:hypothetical protein n=1 Tax=Agrococcus sp. Marseille-P2731 TaxID=1841862 RepID=UPI000931A6C1|nr:hypothetical protein [Agrococcus sp. Marseille-P2731]
MAGPLRVEHDIEVARWVQASLSDLGSVATNVPPIFDAYARILHPATLMTPTGTTDAWGNPEQSSREITWAEAAELIGDRVGERQPWTAWLNRFGQVARDLPDGSLLIEGHTLPDGSRIQEPTDGDIPLPLLGTLTELLLDEHGDAEVLTAFWGGHGLDSAGSVIALAWPEGDKPSRREAKRATRAAQAAHDAAFAAAVDPEVARALREQHELGLPAEGQGRGHVLLRGRLSTFADPAWVERAGLGWRAEWPHSGRTPNALWPVEPHGAPAWFIATDLDLDITLVGGSAHLIGRILGHPSIEAERTRPDDPLV